MSEWVIECHSSASKSPWHDYVIHDLKNWKKHDAMRSWSIGIYSIGLFTHYYPHLIHAQSLKLKLSSRSLLQQSQLSTKLKTIDIRAISEKRNRLGLAWFDMIIIEQCYLFRRGFTKEMAKIKLIQRDLKQADVISFRMQGLTQKQR